LLNFQSADHVINHLDNLVKSDLFPFQCQRYEFKFRVFFFARFQDFLQKQQSLFPGIFRAHLHLHQACRTGKCFLEEFQSVVVIEREREWMSATAKSNDKQHGKENGRDWL